MKILVTGGLGYIGSNICQDLIKRGDQVVVIDNLSNSSLENYLPETFLYPTDLNLHNLNIIFSNHKIDAVIHLAGKKSVSESLKSPLEYYDNNFNCTLQLLQSMEQFKIKNLIFSSSATVYGSQPSPVSESDQTGIGITNPYGRTKYFIEEMLKDICFSDSEFNCSILRYFNPVGSNYNHKLKDNINGENLVPIMMRKLNSNQVLDIFKTTKGDDCCIRDFIHVSDLAKSHLVVLDNLKGLNIFNVGTSKPTLVLDLINSFNKVNNVNLKYKISQHRLGDIDSSFANSDLIKSELGWVAEKTLDEMCFDAFQSLSL